MNKKIHSTLDVGKKIAVAITTTPPPPIRAEDVEMGDATANNEKEMEKKKMKTKSKKKKKTKNTTDDGVIQGGPVVKATDSSNATASTQGVRAGTAHNGYNTRTPDVPMEHYCSAEAIAEGIQAEAEWVA
mmetsp:Transcript_64251/g.71954  ORF Transcript_64251/g.71954 Transcript_64251/m.71954 type:complete len:130 (+) Transcript_64251:235-624(+)